MRGRTLSSSKFTKNVLSVVLSIISVIYVMPVFAVLINSFKQNTFVKTDTFALPNAETSAGFANFIKGMTFGNYPFFNSVLYSVVITLLSTALILIFTSMAAWYISRVDSKLCRMHHLADDKGTDTGNTDAGCGFADGLAGYQAAVGDKIHGFLCLTGLKVAEDNVQLIQKFVVKGTKGIEHALGAGQFIGQAQGFGLIIKNYQNTLDGRAPVTADGRFIDQQCMAAGNKGAAGNGLAGFQNPLDAGLGIDIF